MAISPGEQHSQHMNGHTEHAVSPGPSLQRERAREQAPATTQPAAEVQVKEVTASGLPQAPVEVPLATQEDPVAPSPVATRQSTRYTRGVAPQRMTYEVKGKPTAYSLAECFLTIIQGLVSCVNQKEH